MLDALRLVIDIIDMIMHWRMSLTLLITIGLVALVLVCVPNETIAYSIAIPLGIAGIAGGLYWQHRSEVKHDHVDSKGLGKEQIKKCVNWQEERKKPLE
jgi:hypothetical protein